ncbi:hypothetical protein AX17_005926 [Amanita inopinata Kibby_2008]|nr:hypothetical protein AX17_005926 [Amanita inopinata Kibby_2008]
MVFPAFQKSFKAFKRCKVFKDTEKKRTTRKTGANKANPDNTRDIQFASVCTEVSVDSLTSEDVQVLQELASAYHDPSVLDIRRSSKLGTPRCNMSKGLTKSASTSASSRGSPPPPSTNISPTPSPELLSSSKFAESTDSSSATLVDYRVVDIKDFACLKFIGQGASGTVYLVHDNVSKNKLALKVIEKHRLRYECDFQALLREQRVLRKLSDYPWFITMEASWHDRNNFYLALTYYPTNVASEITRCGVIGPSRSRFYMVEIIIALRALHSRGIIHRDIKSANLLIDRQGHIVLADFGFAKDCERIPTAKEIVTQPYWGYTPATNKSLYDSTLDLARNPFVSNTYCGTVTEMAPEMHLMQPYSFGIDYWAASVTLYYMVTGRSPWRYTPGARSKATALQIVQDDLVFRPYDDVDEDFQDFLRKMLMKEPTARLNVGKPLNSHPYFKGINWKLMEKREVPPPWVPGIATTHIDTPAMDHRDFQPRRGLHREEKPYPAYVWTSELLGGESQTKKPEESGRMDKFLSLPRLLVERARSSAFLHSSQTLVNGPGGSPSNEQPILRKFKSCESGSF